MGVLLGLGASKLALDINKNKNNICLGWGFWASGLSSRVAVQWGGPFGTTSINHRKHKTQKFNIKAANPSVHLYWLFLSLLSIRIMVKEIGDIIPWKDDIHPCQTYGLSLITRIGFSCFLQTNNQYNCHSSSNLHIFWLK